MVKTTVNNIAVNYFGSSLSDYKDLTDNDKEEVSDLILKLTGLISFCKEKGIVFCKMSFVHYLESKKILVIRVSKTVQELNVKLE